MPTLSPIPVISQADAANIMGFIGKYMYNILVFIGIIYVIVVSVIAFTKNCPTCPKSLDK